MELSQESIIAILTVLLAVSELIALNPAYESNSVLQIISNLLKRILKKKEDVPEKSLEDIARDEVIDKIIEEIDKEK